MLPQQPLHQSFSMRRHDENHSLALSGINGTLRIELYDRLPEEQLVGSTELYLWYCSNWTFWLLTWRAAGWLYWTVPMVLFELNLLTPYLKSSWMALLNCAYGTVRIELSDPLPEEQLHALLSCTYGTVLTGLNLPTPYLKSSCMLYWTVPMVLIWTVWTFQPITWRAAAWLYWTVPVLNGLYFLTQYPKSNCMALLNCTFGTILNGLYFLTHYLKSSCMVLLNCTYDIVLNGLYFLTQYLKSSCMALLNCTYHIVLNSLYFLTPYLKSSCIARPKVSKFTRSSRAPCDKSPSSKKFWRKYADKIYPWFSQSCTWIIFCEEYQKFKRS